MTSALGWILVTLAGGYTALMLAFAVGLRRVIRAERRREPAEELPFVSVVVPARDEEAAIGACLDALLAQDYPPDRYEVIVVDDLSRDRTPEIVRAVMARANAPALVPEGPFEDEEAGPQRLHLIQIPENADRTQAHKKRAIEKAIGTARGTVIATTDADCAVPPRWLRRMTACFTGRVAFVSGPVLFRPLDRAAFHVQALEFLGLASMGAGAIGIERPNLCNGANVAYRRDVFEAVGGFSGIDHLTSGDDELLMQRIAYETDWEVVFCASPEAAVETDPVPTFRDFFEQRRRWASKGAHYQPPAVKLTVGLIYAFFVALGLGSLAWPFVPGLGGFVAGAWALKLLGEVSVLGQGCVQFRRAWLLLYLPLAELLHVPYIVGMGAAGALGGYEWKGRRIER